MNNTNQHKAPLTRGVAKVPVIMQMEALECGAACLAMVAAYYGKWVPLEQVKEDYGVSRDGSNAKNVLVAARSYGFVAKGYRYEPEELRKSGTFPCIIHWNFNHFVVLDGFKGNKAVINDPARGQCCVSLEEFDKSFTGICLKIEPGEDFVRCGSVLLGDDDIELMIALGQPVPAQQPFAACGPGDAGCVELVGQAAEGPFLQRHRAHLFSTG